MNRAIRITAAAFAAACSSVLVGAGIASAHIETDPAAVAADSAATVGFNVGHGCDGSNTNELQIKIPDGIVDAKPIDKAGWTAAVAGDAVTFSGGDLDATTPDMFQISFTAPSTPGTIHFPIVQTCAVGETAWIEIQADGAAEPDHPAPAVLVTDGPPTSADLAPHDDDTATPVGSTDASVASTVASIATTATSTAAPAKDDDSSNTGVIVGVIVGAIVILGGAAIIVTKRKRT